MPSPDQLGVALGKPSGSAGLDWAVVHHRLDQLGAVCFNLEKLPQGTYRFTCLLPTAQPGRTHRVEAVAASESEVVRLVLDRSEEWAGGR
jgi:hypothetical protein